MTDDEQEILAALEQEFGPETVVEILAERVAQLEEQQHLDDDHSFDRIDIDALAEVLWECNHRANASDPLGEWEIPPLSDTPKHLVHYRLIAGLVANILLDPDRTPLR